MKDEQPQQKTHMEEYMRRQLLAHSISHEISSVMGAASDLDTMTRALLSGLSDMMQFKRAAYFNLSHYDFSLDTFRSFGIEPEKLNKIKFGLGFENGPYTDAIFLNRHIYVDSVEKDDPFSKLGTQKYIVFPITARVFHSDGSLVRCGNPDCPCAHAQSPYWWADSMPEAFEGMDENTKRRKSILCPEFRCFGLLWLDLDEREKIQADDINAISTILTRAGLIIENFRNREKLQQTNQRLMDVNDELEAINRANSREIEKARKIQRGLLPHRFPQGILRDVAARYIPTSKVAGDYYDCFMVDKDTLGLVVADVSGHGVAAGLFMSMFKVMIKSFAKGHTPAETLTRINNTFIEETASDHYVTAFYGMFDPVERELLYVNAAHPPILLYDKDNKSLQEMPSTGFLVGALDTFSIRNWRISVPPNSRLLFYTDGITEAQSPEGKEYGLEKLKSMLDDHAENSCRDFLSALAEDLTLHVRSDSLDDDVTLMCVDL